MKILILGASGYVGARIYKDLKSNYDVVGTYSSTKLFPELLHLDITDKNKVEELIHEVNPTHLIHIANNASNGWCDAHPEEALILNVTSTEYIVEACNKINAKVIYMSSIVAINPDSYYAETKQKSENIVKDLAEDWVILRPSFIIGYSPNTTNDRPYNRLLKNIKAKVPVGYDNEWQFQPTWLGHISEITELVIKDNLSKLVIPIVVPEYTTRFGIAKDILAAFGINVSPISKDKPSKVVDMFDDLNNTGLPTYSYKEIIEKIIKETKENLAG